MSIILLDILGKRDCAYKFFRHNEVNFNNPSSKFINFYTNLLRINSFHENIRIILSRRLLSCKYAFSANLWKIFSPSKKIDEPSKKLKKKISKNHSEGRFKKKLFVILNSEILNWIIDLSSNEGMIIILIFHIYFFFN